MKNNIAKKTIILYVLTMLENGSSKDQPITLTHMTKVLNYMGVDCDRKTIGRNVDYLIDFGYPIVKIEGGGCFMNGKIDLQKVWRHIEVEEDEECY